MKVKKQNELMLEDLERRVAALEAAWRGELYHRECTLADRLVIRYGECVDKTVAAKILGVTRATVYVMLADGRITGACEGRRVDVHSIARYLSAGKKGGNEHEGNAD